MSSYLENSNKVSGFNPVRLLWGGAVLGLFSASGTQHPETQLEDTTNQS